MRITRSRYAIALLAVALFLVVALATRVSLLAIQPVVLHDGFLPLARALVAGFRQDITAALWLALPLVLFLTVLPERWWRTRAQQRIQAAGMAAWVFVLLFVALAELFFFEEFTGRFNFVAVDYLIYPTEIMVNIWESFPTGWILFGLAIVTVIGVRLLRPTVRQALAGVSTVRQRLVTLAFYSALLATATMTTSARTAHVSQDRVLNEVAANGWYSLWSAFLGQDAPYEGWYATRAAPVLFQRLHHLLVEPATDTSSFVAGSTLRLVRGDDAPRALNVVVVLEESFGSEFVDILHHRDTVITPNFDSLASGGILFTRAYSTGNRTIRALEATTASLPPLPGVSIVRRERSHDLFTLPALLRSRGYATEFVYGGRALFDGMGSYMRANGMENVVEQKDFPDTAFATAWGVSDEAIFDRALVEMDSLHRTGKPFYTLVLTVSNHRPYLYPTGRIAGDPEARRREQAVEYADYALGRFIRQARSHAFFDNTLFVLMGDHGARVYGAAEIPLPSYQVPILLYAPGVLPAGQRVNTLASSMDVPATILGVLGMGYESKMFGRDLLRLPSTDGRALMTHNNSIALMRDSRDGMLMAVLGLQQSASVYRVDEATNSLSRIAEPDSAGRALIEDAIAYYAGADWIYRNGEYDLATALHLANGAAAQPH